jgi:hypothetical protein
MKTQKTRRIGKLAEALLLLEATKKAMDTAQIEFNESLLKAQTIALAELEKPFDTQEKIVLWRNAAYAGLQVSKAQDGLSKAQECLAGIIDQMRPGAPTVTATNKNRIPFITSEMESDWVEVQDKIESEDDKLRFSQFVSESNLDRPNCKCCRRLKAQLNSNSKPSKARK